MADRLRVVGGEALDVLDDEPRAFERECHAREVQRLAIGEHIAFGERPSRVVVAVLELGDAVVQEAPAGLE